LTGNQRKLKEDAAKESEEYPDLLTKEVSQELSEKILIF
jgi:hypothetical protein